MELRHLRYFVMVAEEGSVNRAARRLLVSQPSLSRQIVHLERQLGQQLLQRTSRGVRLTPAGQALLPHAHQLLAMADATRETVAGARAVRQRVTIGVPPGTDGAWLIAAVDAVRARVPDAAPEYVEATSSDQLRLLRQGRLDICLVHQAPPDGHAVREVRRDPLGIAVRPGHPLAARGGYRLSDLDGLRTLLHAQDRVPTEQHGLIAAAQAAGVRPHWHFSQFTEHALAHAHAAECDAVLVVAHTAAAQLPGWRWEPLSDLPLTMTTYLATESDTRAVVGEVARAIAGLGSAGAPGSGGPW
ncbi:LysR family transcriptional regulator [Streptomyces cinerochromogenes]|uniref:LysR family transcriptional regulator n=1 Tax=Streptomyces cinerochromogenes TaxID=66422 RepID=UPI00166FFBD7|nr:LysR family transcriptional regulator [Streptomyces cinerochromogenes]